MDNLRLAALVLRLLRLAHEELILHAHHLIGAVAVEENHVVDIGTVADVFVLLQSGANEALLAVDVEFLIGLHHFGGRDGVEALDFRQTRMVFAVFLAYVVEPLTGDVYHVGQFAVYLLDFVLDGGNVLLRLVLVELEDARHTNLHQAQDVLLRHLAHHLRIPGRQTLVDPLAGFVHRLGLLKLAVLVDTLLDEDLLQRSEMQLLRKLSLANETLLFEQIERVVHTALEHIAHGEEHRLAVVDDAAVGRDALFAVGAGIEGVDGLVARSTRLQMHQDFHRSCRHVLHFAHLDFALLGRLQYAVDEGGGLGGGAGSLAERQLRDGQRLAVALLYLGAHSDHAAALSVVVARHIDGAARGKVGIEMKFLSAQIFHGSLADFTQIVGQYFA